MKPIGSLGIATALLLALAGCGSSPGAAPTPTGPTSAPLSDLTGQIFFTKAGGTFNEGTPFVMNADGSNVREIPGSTPDDCCLQPSPDGSTVVMSGPNDDGHLTNIVQRLTSTARRYLPLPDKGINFADGIWTPGGKRLTVHAWDDANPERNGIYLLDLASGKVVRRLTTEHTGTPESPLAYSPDGKWLLFFREYQDNKSTGDLLLINAAGTTPARLVTTSRDVAIGGGGFSPDGSRILFANGRATTVGALWTVKPDGTGLTKVWDDDTLFAGSPAWSPDGTKITFTLNTISDEFQHVPNTLAVINADGSNLREIVNDGDFRREVTWVP